MPGILFVMLAEFDQDKMEGLLWTTVDYCIFLIKGLLCVFYLGII
jgi:hypothetical protein